LLIHCTCQQWHAQHFHCSHWELERQNGVHQIVYKGFGICLRGLVLCAIVWGLSVNMD
jgi:hypothetical protein